MTEWLNQSVCFGRLNVGNIHIQNNVDSEFACGICGVLRFRKLAYFSGKKSLRKYVPYFSEKIVMFPEKINYYLFQKIIKEYHELCPK